MKAKQLRRARKLAFQALFMLDARKEWDLSLAREFLGRTQPTPPADVRALALSLVADALAAREEIDAWLDQVNPHWRLARMRSEDRNILRLGLVELWRRPDVPTAAAINEWLEIAKAFSAEDAPKFINAVLDRGAKEAPSSPS